jgi:hypothetical protein
MKSQQELAMTKKRLKQEELEAYGKGFKNGAENTGKDYTEIILSHNEELLRNYHEMELNKSDGNNEVGLLMGAGKRKRGRPKFFWQTKRMKQ